MDHIKEAEKALKKGKYKAALAHGVLSIAHDFHEAWEAAKDEDEELNQGVKSDDESDATEG